MTAVRFTARGPHHYSVNFAYNPTIIEIVKSVPSHDRTYDATTKTWMVGATHVQALARYLRAVGFTVLGVEQPSDWGKNLFVAVGPERAAEVRRPLTKALHPDNPNGAPDLQRDLNTAYDQLGDRYYRDAR